MGNGFWQFFFRYWQIVFWCRSFCTWRKIHASVVLATIIAVAPPVFAAKRMLIMDFRNRDGDANFQYLQEALTESVRKSIHDRYEIIEPDRTSVESRVRAASFIFPAEFHNRNIALQFGIINDQDIVISGVFARRITARQTSEIQVEAFILDVQQQKVLREFRANLLVDANIFVSVDRLAKRFADEARSVLPNKGSLEFDQYAPISPDMIAFIGAYKFGSVLNSPGDQRQISSRGRILPDMVGGPALAFEWRHDRFLNRNRWIIQFQGALQWIDAQSSTAAGTGNVVLRGNIWSAYAAIGYQWFRFKRFYSIFMTGPAFMYAQVKLDYASLAVQPTNLDSGNTSDRAAGSMWAPMMHTNLRLGFQANHSLSWEAGIGYQVAFMNSGITGNFLIQLGAGYRL